MSVMFTMSVNPSRPMALHEQIGRYLDQLGVVIEADAARYAAVKTGKMRGSLYHERDGMRLRVGVRNVDYWMAQEYGAGPHIIRPVAKKALHWPGALHPVAKVNHPGNPARPFLRPSLYTRRGAL